MPLTGLAELSLGMLQPAVVPAALGQLKGLRSLTFRSFSPCVLEAGCLELPNLLSLSFEGCDFDFGEDAQMLPGVASLQCLTRIEFRCNRDMCFFDPQPVQLPRLQRLVFSSIMWDDVDGGAAAGLLRLPADMGRLASLLLHVELSGLGLTYFPLALTQLVALEYLDASGNRFARLPAGVTALSRLTQLTLGRCMSPSDPLQLRKKRCLGVRALGDLSGFPALRELSFSFSEVIFSPSMLGAVRHACLTSLSFSTAHPAPDCAPMVLLLSQVLRRMRQRSVLRCLSNALDLDCVEDALDEAEGRAPCQKFMTAMEACGL